MRKIPTITSDVRRASAAIVKVLDPMRSNLIKLTGKGDDRAVMGSELATIESRVAALEGLQALSFDASDTSGDVIGRDATADDTGSNDSSTWETVRTFKLMGSGTIAVRINAWFPQVGAGSIVQNGQARVLKNDIEVGTPEDLPFSSSNEEVWTPLKAVASDEFKIQLIAGIQDDGGNFDAPSNIAWSEVRALVRHVEWS